ncbi:hypothetical protein BX666DRAFT_1980447 [Dichotomocladium elegans]|nr:hypothetical protein BX666DRAFT_1980447 [Dichotomocladium elegans]
MNPELPFNVTVSAPSAEKGSSSSSAGHFQLHDNIQHGQSSRWNPYYRNTLTVENRYLSLLTLIDIAYPPHICTLCDRIFPTSTEANHHHRTTHRTRRFRCLHPHCELRFSSRAALRYHISRSHLVKQASAQCIIQEPPFMHYKVEPLIGTFPPSPATPCPRGSSPSPREARLLLPPASEEFINATYPPLVCPCCHKQFHKNANIDEHIEAVHHGQEPYRCVYPNCTTHDNHFATRDGLIRHILQSHCNNVSPRPNASGPICEYRNALL